MRDKSGRFMRDADTAIAFCLEGQFELSGSGRFAGRTKDIYSYEDVVSISERATRHSVDYFGNMSLGVNNLFHRRSMRVSGLPLFVSSVEYHNKFPAFNIEAIVERADDKAPSAPEQMSSGEITLSATDKLRMLLYLGKNDWENFQRGATHPKGVRFRFWFSEQIQRASGVLDGMEYHIKTDIDGIAKEKDLGDGSARGNSYQTIKEFDIIHSGDIESQRVVFWAQVAAFGF